VLGLITIVAVQRAIHKVLISVFLSREFKHDETNRAWWTGKWYGRGLGAHVLSQPAREFIVKIIELSLWSSDFLIGHFLMFMLTPAILVPYIDQLHSILLCKSHSKFGQQPTYRLPAVWLRPSKQIHAPIFNIKVRKQRRAIVSIRAFPNLVKELTVFVDYQICSHIFYGHCHLRRLDCCP
jgi:1,3-beta-glucan synthase